MKNGYSSIKYGNVWNITSAMIDKMRMGASESVEMRKCLVRAIIYDFMEQRICQQKKDAQNETFT